MIKRVAIVAAVRVLAGCAGASHIEFVASPSAPEGVVWHDTKAALNEAHTVLHSHPNTVNGFVADGVVHVVRPTPETYEMDACILGHETLHIHWGPFHGNTVGITRLVRLELQE